MPYADPEKRRAAGREAMRRWRAANPDRVRESNKRQRERRDHAAYQRAWKERNPEKVKASTKRRYDRLKNPCPLCGELKKGSAEFCLSCRRGEQHHSWRGGSWLDRYGYRMVRAPGEPGARKNGYIPEHRLVMQRMLGRPLRPEESVHHKNGQRDDNRPENLELWVKSQPNGQRAEDLVAWAREILERYG